MIKYLALLAALVSPLAHAYTTEELLGDCRAAEETQAGKKNSDPFHAIRSARCIAYVAGFADGYAVSDFLADKVGVKLNALGVIEWQRSLGGSYSEMVPKVRAAAGGGYYVCTNTISHDGDVSDHHNQPDDWISDIWVVRLDEEGGTLWQRCLGGTGEDVPGVEA